jgi:hypothetical protein
VRIVEAAERSLAEGARVKLTNAAPSVQHRTA